MTQRKKYKRKKHVIFYITVLSIILITVGIFIQIENRRRDISKINLDAVSAIVVDKKNDEILYGKEIDKRVSPGSITKLVSMFVVFDNIKSNSLALTEEVEVSQNASSTMASRVGLRPGEKMTVDNLIKCILIASGSDAMLALAEHISGSEERFVELMNKKVTQLGLENTQFAGCIGLENTNTYSSAYDIATIVSAITTDYPQIYEYTKLHSVDIVRQDKSILSIKNTNDMLSIDGIDGLKTGSTPQSGYNLAMTYNKKGKSIVFIVLNSKTLYFRKQDCLQLIDVFV